MDGAVKETRELDFTLTDQANAEDRGFIHHQIKAFNDSVSEHHRAVRGPGPTPLDVFIRDSQDRLRGGLVASTYWDWLEIDDLWIEESLRGLGFGRELLSMAEAEAKARGCSHAFLQTFGFQASGFYEELGYRVVGCLEDYPPGRKFFWMRKDFYGPASH
jgi:ribosomal protein S18 acetylase RimI-like enzyme